MIFKSLASLLFPSRCIGCESWLDVPEQICPACYGALNFLKTPAHLPKLSKQYFDAAYSAVAYEGELLQWVARFKYHQQFYVGRELASLLIQAPVDFQKYDFFVPVPLHWRRQFRRGFNHSHFLAHSLGKKTCKPVATFLKRIRFTPAQAKLTSEERLKNIQGAFALNAFAIRAKNIREKSILLIDDVLTTGATVNACAKVLHQAGAKHIDILTVARAL